MTTTTTLFAAYHPDHGLNGSRWQHPVLIRAESSERAEEVVRSLADTEWEIGPAGPGWDLNDSQSYHLNRHGWVEFA